MSSGPRASGAPHERAGKVASDATRRAVRKWMSGPGPACAKPKRLRFGEGRGPRSDESVVGWGVGELVGVVRLSQGQTWLEHHPDRREAAAMMRRGPEP